MWEWIAGRSYSLNVGLHALTVGGRESETRLDRVLITDDPGFVPTEQPTHAMHYKTRIDPPPYDPKFSPVVLRSINT